MFDCMFSMIILNFFGVTPILYEISDIEVTKELLIDIIFKIIKSNQTLFLKQFKKSLNKAFI